MFTIYIISTILSLISSTILIMIDSADYDIELIFGACIFSFIPILNLVAICIVIQECVKNINIRKWLGRI